MPLRAVGAILRAAVSTAYATASGGRVRGRDGTRHQRSGRLAAGHGHDDDDDRAAARDQALRPPAAPRSGAASAAERAPGPRGRGEADARLRAGRLRQDDAAGRVAGGRAGRRPVGGVALARPGRQRPRALLDLPDRRAADGGARGRRGRARAPAVAAAAADRGGPGHAAQRARRRPGRRRAGARRLPRHRRARRPGRAWPSCSTTSRRGCTW